MLEIRILNEAQVFLDSLEAKPLRQISEKIFRLAETPFPRTSKQVEGYAPLRKIRSGDYRIIYFVEGTTLKVALIDKRGDDQAYRRMERKFRS